MSETHFKLEIAERDVAFVKGLPVQGSGEFMLDDKDIGFEVKVKAGEPYILHVNSDHVIPIVNVEDRWNYDNLYAVNTTAIGGYHGVYADSVEEALHIFADYCAEMVPDPDDPGEMKQRLPGLIWDWSEMQDEEEEYPEEFDGPWGDGDWYFTERGHPASATLVHDPKIPPVPSDLFPFQKTWTLTELLDLSYPQTMREYLLTETFYDLRDRVISLYHKQDWCGRLEDLIDEAGRNPKHPWLMHMITTMTNPESGIAVFIIERDSLMNLSQ